MQFQAEVAVVRRVTQRLVDYTAQGIIYMVSYRSLLHENLGFAMQFGKCVTKFCVKHMVHTGSIMQLSSSIEVATQEMSSNLYPAAREAIRFAIHGSTSSRLVSLYYYGHGK